MGRLMILAVVPALLGAGPEQAAAPVLGRTFPLPDVHGAADRTGISGRIDHMAYDPATRRLFIACVANGSLEVIDLAVGKRVGTLSGLRGPQGVAVSGNVVYVSTGDDGMLHQFDTRTLATGKTVPVGDDADNVRTARDGTIWVSFGGAGPGGFICFDGSTLALERKIGLPRMPEGFQLHPSGAAIFANVPAGKRSAEDGTVVGLKRPYGEPLWERKLAGRAGNFPMALDPANDRVFLVARKPARLISLSVRDGSVLGETPCPPESDDLFFDDRSGLVAVIGAGRCPSPATRAGAGASLDLFAIDDAVRPSALGRLTTAAPQSNWGTGTPIGGRFHVGVPEMQGRPAEVREYRLSD